MTRAAGEYFRDLQNLPGASYGNDRVPGILSGRPQDVSHGQRLPIHRVEAEKLETRLYQIESSSLGHMYRAAYYLSRIAHLSAPRVPMAKYDAEYMQVGDLGTLFGNLIPDNMVTGHLSKFRLEAVTGAELPDSVHDAFEKTRENATSQYPLAYTEAFIMATAEVFAGTALGKVGKVVHMTIEARHDDRDRMREIVGSRVASHELSWSEKDALQAARRGRAGIRWFNPNEMPEHS